MTKEIGMYDGLFTTWGPERGCCGHVHDSIEKAWVCLEQDRIESQGSNPSGGTDRQLRQLETVAAMDNWNPEAGPGLSVPYVAWEHLADPEAFRRPTGRDHARLGGARRPAAQPGGGSGFGRRLL